MEENDISSVCGRAVLNVKKCLAPEFRFPRNVFVGRWDQFFFFDADRIFDSAFVDHVKTLLAIEGAACACLVNLDASTETADGDRQFFIDSNTTVSSYKDLLRGHQPGEGWIHDIGRFGCASDLCQWAIYCERNNEIAAIAIQSQPAFDRYRLLLSRLKATGVTDAVSKPMSYGFSPEALSREWRDLLIREYGSAE
jgi:hypothetical protein